jgi:hypothetical protein
VILERLKSGGSQFEDSLGKILQKILISKITRAKWTGDVAQVQIT